MFGATAFIAELFRFTIPNYSLSLIGGGAFSAMTVCFVVGWVMRAGSTPPRRLLISVGIFATLTAWIMSFTTLSIAVRVCLIQFLAGFNLAIGMFYARVRLKSLLDYTVMFLVTGLVLILILQPFVLFFTTGLPQTRAEYDVSLMFSIVRFALGVAALSTAMLLVGEYISLIISDLRYVADRDKLTGLLNRRGFENAFIPLNASTQARNEQVALILFDLDNFKTVNDTYGHVVGDQVIKGLGDLLKSHSGDNGIAARMGGEEFVLALPVASLKDGVKHAELMRQRWARRAHYAEEEEFSCTASIGVALHAAETLSTVTFTKADEALYLAKQTGRNKVVSETDLHVAKLRVSARRDIAPFRDERMGGGNSRRGQGET